MVIKIAHENSNRRLDKYLFSYLNNAPRSLIYKLLRKKRIKLNGSRAVGNEILQAGDEITLFLADETIEGCKTERIIKEAKPLTGIIFEDESLLVLNKPVGLASQGGSQAHDNLLARVLFYLRENAVTPALCNRLDVNTSGLVICGKTIHALQEINALFSSRQVKKTYLAIVCGMVGEVGTSCVLEDFYEKDMRTNTARVLSEVNTARASGEGKTKIITRYTVLAAQKDYSLLCVSPITGRSHQIRVHLAHINHPLAGDKKYGGDTRLATHQLLHCHRMELAQFKFTAPPPKRLEDIIKRLFDVDLS
ncbi:MAG: RluA family pseudouridine synthase [Defluviitaleaceae bacterium]|nr:RluA family pseudouridine synthase [Defluviitaleaceae bacterium]